MHARASHGAGVAALLVCCVVACGKGQPDRAAPPLLPVQGAGPLRAAAAAVAVDLGFIGVVVAGDWVEVEPKVEARIEEVFVKPGDEVRRGTPLARLDVQASAHELAMARAGLREASRRMARRVRAAKSRPDAVTAEELDAARRELTQERARVAKLAQASAEATLRAPFDGAVVERYLSPGALAGPNRPILRLLGQGEPRVRFAVPEDRAGRVGLGDAIEIRLTGATKLLRGQVTGINPEIDSSSRMVYASGALQMPAAAAGEKPALSTGVIARVFLVKPSAAETER